MEERTAIYRKTINSGGERPEKDKTGGLRRVRESLWLNLAYFLLAPAALQFCSEWIARGTLEAHRQGNGFFESLQKHFPSFLIAYLLLVVVYACFTCLLRSHTVGALVTGLLAFLPAVATYYKLTMRNEPLLPWDLNQIGDLMAVKSSVELKIQTPMVVSAVALLLLAAGGVFVVLPKGATRAARLVRRLAVPAGCAGLAAVLVLGIFMNPAATTRLGIREDHWMQDRYYRTNGMITGFLSNLQMMKITTPEGYGAEAVENIAEEVGAGYGGDSPLYAGAPGSIGETPDIIFVMAESFWDVTRLPGIEYDRELLPNLTRLAAEGAYGDAYSPSFGGGTCDVEFEALTGFSVENLPSGSKPYQQYVTDDTASLAWHLKDQGYDTLAIHGYGRRFWNRDVAYPRLGIDTFIAQDDFVDPVIRRNFISDESMVSRIIEEHAVRTADGTPVFIHAVTMQNHTTYDRSKYPADELVRVTKAPDALQDSTIGQLEDCATGIYEMDAALGQLTDYLRTTSRPTILVLWGDHMNAMTDGYTLFEETGLIGKDETDSPELRKMPLLIWDNQGGAGGLDLGTLSTYNISPVMMDLYDLERPVLFEYLVQQMDVLHGRTRGVTIQPDNSTSQELTEQQAESVHGQALLQYDLLFGDKTLENIE